MPLSRSPVGRRSAGWIWPGWARLRPPRTSPIPPSPSRWSWRPPCWPTPNDQARTAGFGPGKTVVAGHSVGEIAAYAIAGVICPDDAVKLAAVRGSEMAKACAVEPTGMSAVLGGDEAEVLARLEALELVPANRNAAGQIVAAGSVTALEKLAEDPPAKARVRQLATAGAFHTHYMASAMDGYATAAAEIAVNDPITTLLCPMSTASQ